MNNKNEIKNTVMISNMISFDHITNNKVSKIFRKYDNNMYGFINYDKNYLSLNDTHTGIYRSIVFSYPERKVLSYCPSKSISYSYYKSLFPLLNADSYLTKYIEGQLVQLFYDNRQETWLLANENNFSCFEKKNDITTMELFLKSIGYDKKFALNELPFLKNLSKLCNYVFIISSRDMETPKLYLINVYQIHCNLPNSIYFIPEFEYSKWDEIKDIKKIHFPEKLTFESYSDLDEHLQYLHKPQKLVLINNKTGMRTHIENKEHIFVERTKLVNPFNRYLFFCLNRICKNYKICDIYPQYSRDMYEMKTNFEYMIDNIHQTYVDYFILKKTSELQDPFKKYLIDIHKTYYIPSIQTRKRILITRKTVKDYFNLISPFELYNLLETI